ncbi:mitoferrin-1 isoform X3 [Takifugu flavidus]|uniref:mitoferrin-1 isoform X3 n=1 Tax=Takifugu flavidus TaxID=433684 RepID=UPI002544AD58|nr:mitoferrin-1 isoform X3 [Takifugu flavidus]
MSERYELLLRSCSSGAAPQARSCSSGQELLLRSCSSGRELLLRLGAAPQVRSCSSGQELLLRPGAAPQVRSCSSGQELLLRSCSSGQELLLRSCSSGQELLLRLGAAPQVRSSSSGAAPQELLLNPHPDVSSVPGVAGSVATVLHDVVMNPAEVIKQRLQMFGSPYRGLWDCVVRVTRAEGVGAFYRSFSTQLTMNIPFQAVHFITYELMQEQLNPHRRYRPGSHIVSGAAAGAISAAVTTPLDVCKTLLNTQENVALSSLHISGHLSGMANAFRTVYRLGGPAAFFKGVQARVIYQMPSTAIAWSVYEFFKYFLTKQQKQDVEAGAGRR